MLIHNPKTCQSRSASLRIETVPSRGDRIPEKSKSDREKPAAFLFESLVHQIVKSGLQYFGTWKGMLMFSIRRLNYLIV